MSKVLHYLFDPLCGWCYGANGPLPRFVESHNLTLNLLPTGLFANQGARQMTPEFAAYAWQNDQRIGLMTGQPFSDTYRQAVLGDFEQGFNSGPATMALTAVHLTVPLEEYQALNAIQYGRYVEGRDITQLSVLADILSTCGLQQAQQMVVSKSQALHEATALRIRQGQQRLQSVNARGVPTFILEESTGSRMISSSDVFAYARGSLPE